MYTNPYDLYKEQSVKLATPSKLIIMLYDAAIKNINIADQAILTHKVADAHAKLILCQDIFQELIMSLDYKYAISNNLLVLYEYINSQLVEANLKKNRDILQALLPMVTELRNTWEEAEKLSRIQNFKAVKNHE